MKTTNLADVRKYYGRRYKEILDAFEDKNVKSYSIDEQCGRYLELSVLMENGNKIFVNHGISNSKPYNVTVTPSQTWYGKPTHYRLSNQYETAKCIKKEEYFW